MPKPFVSADALASLAAVVPPRITKRLDANPAAAGAWAATEGPDGYVVATDGEDRVTVTGDVVHSIDQIACTCLHPADFKAFGGRGIIFSGLCNPV